MPQFEWDPHHLQTMPKCRRSNCTSGPVLFEICGHTYNLPEICPHPAKHGDYKQRKSCRPRHHDESKKSARPYLCLPCANAWFKGLGEMYDLVWQNLWALPVWGAATVNEDWHKDKQRMEKYQKSCQAKLMSRQQQILKYASVDYDVEKGGSGREEYALYEKDVYDIIAYMREGYAQFGTI